MTPNWHVPFLTMEFLITLENLGQIEEETGKLQPLPLAWTYKELSRAAMVTLVDEPGQETQHVIMKMLGLI